jgi:hypothetical protein
MITLVSSWYVLNSKFKKEIYEKWIDNLLSNVNKFNLVIFTDNKSKDMFNNINNNINIKIIIKEMNEFYTFKKYDKKWVLNHLKNNELNKKCEWKLNMLWCEKINMVKEVIENKYFDSEYYGWCDIGYFRCSEKGDLTKQEIKYWPDNNKINNLNKNKVYYGLVNFNKNYISKLESIINNKNQLNLPSIEIPPNQISIAGGFFLLNRNKIDWWFDTFYKKLELYMKYDRLIKDDQILIINCILENENKNDFELIYDFDEKNKYNPWFVFQRYLNINKKVSILMPIYNGIEFINESVNSIINQSFKNWELIIGINGHPENSDVFKIANQFKNDKIMVLDLFTIKGKSEALNMMIKYCNNEYVALLDVDDIWLSSKLEEQVKYMYNYDVIGTMCKYFGDRDGVPKIPVNDISNFNFKSVNPIINSSSLIRKEYCYWDGKYNGVEDYDLWLRLRKVNKKFYNVDKILVLHRIHNDSAFNAKGNNLKVNQLLSNY